MLLVPKIRDLFAIGEVIMNGNETVSRVRYIEKTKSIASCNAFWGDFMFIAGYCINLSRCMCYAIG